VTLMMSAAPLEARKNHPTVAYTQT
jgi:hypothetical protein